MCTTPNRMDIFILREFRKGNSERLPRQLGSTPNGYGSRYFTKPVVCASLGWRAIKKIHVTQENNFTIFCKL